MTPLDAVNMMLDAIGEDRVNSLNTGYTEATQALKVLNSTSRTVQTKGWWFNRDLNTTLHPDKDGLVPLPLNTLSVSFPPNSTYVQRGLRVYNRDKHTYEIGTDVKCDIIVLLDFEELPASAQNYVVVHAIQKFQTQLLGSQTLSSFEIEDANKAMIELLEDETLNGQYNVFNNQYIQQVGFRGI
ncbi:TPA: hypothetical protein ACX6Q6_003553 [Photobacterium damselae]